MFANNISLKIKSTNIKKKISVSYKYVIIKHSTWFKKLILLVNKVMKYKSLH